MRSRRSPRAGADLNKASGDGSTAMLVAIQNGHYDVARYLVEKGADINKANEKGWTPLYLAVKHRNLETGTIPVPNQNQSTDFIKLLLDRDVDVNARVKANTEIRNGQRATWFNEAGATAFVRAALVRRHRDDAHAAGQGRRPEDRDGGRHHRADGGGRRRLLRGFIHYRSKEESIAAVKLLLELGADVNAQNEGGLTALHGAAHRAALDEIKLLVEHGAEPDARIEAGRAVRQLEVRSAAARLGAGCSDRRAVGHLSCRRGRTDHQDDEGARHRDSGTASHARRQRRRRGQEVTIERIQPQGLELVYSSSPLASRVGCLRSCRAWFGGVASSVARARAGDAGSRSVHRCSMASTRRRRHAAVRSSSRSTAPAVTAGTSEGIVRARAQGRPLPRSVAGVSARGAGQRHAVADAAAESRRPADEHLPRHLRVPARSERPSARARGTDAGSRRQGAVRRARRPQAAAHQLAGA